MSGRIPQNFIDEVLRRTDIVELIGNYIRLKKLAKLLSFAHFTTKNPSF